MEEEIEANKYRKLLLIFNGPIHETLVYIYYQAYKQDVDTLTHIKKNELDKYFDKYDVSFLNLEKRPQNLPFILLTKVLEHCCKPSLFPKTTGSQKHNENSCEDIIISFRNSYKQFLLEGTDSIGCNFEDVCLGLKTKTLEIIEKSTKFSATNNGEIKENVAKLFSSIESSSFGETYPIIDLLHIELSSINERLMLIFENELDFFHSKSWNLKMNPKEINKFCEEDDLVDIELENVFALLFKHNKRLLRINGSQGIGKTTLSTCISVGWWCHVPFGNLNAFDLVLPFESTKFDKSFGFFSSFINNKNKNSLTELLKDKKILLIVDDMETYSEYHLQSIKQMLENFPSLYLAFLENHSNNNINFGEIEPITLQFNGYKEEKLFSLATQWTYPDSSPNEFIQSNINRFRRLIQYPSLLKEICSIWSVNSFVIKKTSTMTELMWRLYEWKAKQHLNIDLNYSDDKRKRLYKWMMSLGKLIIDSNLLKKKIDLPTAEVVKKELDQLFPSLGLKFYNSLFKSSESQCSTKRLSRPSIELPMLEFICGWYIMEASFGQISIQACLKEPEMYTNAILFSAGHLYRLQDEGNITIKDEKRIIKAFVKYSVQSFEDLPFIFNFVTELKYVKRLVDIVVDETEYNEEWTLNSKDIQFKSLSTMLAHVSPVRLIFMLDTDIYKNGEIIDILTYVCRVQLSVWLDSSCQFCYDNKQSMDALLQPFLTAEKVIPKLDLLCGRLTTKTITNICTTPCFQSLVLLKLRITDKKGLNVALQAPKSLKRLLWLEIRIDLNLDDININSIKKTDVPLFDVHLRRIEESQVTRLADFLVKMHSRYTGIHLDETSFTPEGVYTLLKELSKRKIVLCAEKESVNKFRRWYYPNVSAIKRWKPLTEEQILELIGYDDSNFYSDHHVTSSRFVTQIDAWNLSSYLEQNKNIKHFCYEANNISFTKELDGKVEVSFKGEYWAKIEESARKMSKDTNTVLNISSNITAFA